MWKVEIEQVEKIMHSRAEVYQKGWLLMFFNHVVWGPRPDPKTLPTISLDEVRADHGEKVWVTWDGGVFDVTEFLEVHPGGEHRIRMANGCDLHAYWDLYRLHHRHHIQDLLQNYRIGNLTPEDAKKSMMESNFGDMYIDEPPRPKKDQLRIPSVIPWNSEPQLKVMIKKTWKINQK